MQCLLWDALYVCIMYNVYVFLVPKTMLCIQVCQGRVLDYKRKFIEAASRYNELSYKTAIHDR